MSMQAENPAAFPCTFLLHLAGGYGIVKEK